MADGDFDISTAKPVVAPGGGFDLKTAKPVGAPSAAAPASEPQGVEQTIYENLPVIGTGSREAAWNLATGAVAKPVSDVAGLAAIPLHAAGVIQTSPADVKAAVQSAGTYEPKTKSGQMLAEYNPMALVGKALQWGGSTMRGIIDPAKNEGGVRAAVGQGVEELVNQIPSVFGARGSVPKAAVERPAPAVAPKAAGAGAEKVVNEMQRQSDTSNLPVRGEVGQSISARETALLELDEATKTLRNAAFANPARVNMAEALATIERTKAGTNIPSVIKALDQAKAIIEDGIEKSKPKGPETGRMTAAEYRAMNEQGAGGTMPVKMLDETRQAIKAIMDSEEGGFAKKELLGVQDAMMKYAPKEYTGYVSEYARRAQGLEPFKAPGGAMGKTTVDPAVFNTLNAADKQGMIEKVFTGDTPGRGLTELVRDTAHNPQAAQGLKQAYTDWLTSPDPKTQLPKSGELVKKWADTREAVQSSKLMTPEHIAAMDKIVEDIRTGGGVGKLAKAWASTAGFMGGMMVGRPIMGAHLARDVATQQVSKANAAALEKAVMQIAGTPEGAAALAAPPTPANVAAVRQMLPGNVAAMLTTAEAQQQQQQPMRAKRLLSMQPAGL